MKYITIFVVMLLLSGLSWLNFEKTPPRQQVKIYGTVPSIDGEVVLNIQDSYLKLSAHDRFSFNADETTVEQLSMSVIVQPEHQLCEIFTLKRSNNAIYLDISCKETANVKANQHIATL